MPGRRLMAAALPLSLVAALAPAAGARPLAHPDNGYHAASKHHAKHTKKTKRAHRLRARSAASTSALYVDSASLGGKCSDARAATAVTAATPWCTLTRAGAAAPAGSVIIVRKGNYARFTLNGSRPATPVTYQAAAGETPVVAGAEITNSSRFRVSGFKFTSGVYLTTVSDLAFTNVEVALKAKGLLTDTGFTLTGIQNALFDGLNIHDGFDGMNFRWGGTKQVDVRNSTFQNLGDDALHLGQPNQVRVVHNEFINVNVRSDMDPLAHSDSVQVMGPAADVLFDGNLMRDSRGIMLQFGPKEYALKGAALKDIVVTNNVFAGPDFAVRAFSSPGLRIVNNTAWGTRTGAGNGIDIRGGVSVNAKTTDVVLQNNIIRQLTVDPTVTFAANDHNLVASGAVATASSLITRAPAFLNASTFDLHLAAGSPGINAGVATVAPAADRDGRLRSGAPDLGAYEFGGAVPATATLPSLASTLTPAPVAAPVRPAAVAPKPAAAPTKSAATSQRTLAAKKAAQAKRAAKAKKAKKAKRARAHKKHAKHHRAHTKHAKHAKRATR